jgi:hypothetical protein
MAAREQLPYSALSHACEARPQRRAGRRVHEGKRPAEAAVDLVLTGRVAGEGMQRSTSARTAGERSAALLWQVRAEGRARSRGERATRGLNLLAGCPNVATRLAAQTTGSFLLLNWTLTPPTRELPANRPLMKTQQLADHEIAALARAGRAETAAPLGRATRADLAAAR